MLRPATIYHIPSYTFKLKSFSINDSQHEIWETWLQQEGLSHLTDHPASPLPPLVLSEQVELAHMVQDILGQLFPFISNLRQLRKMERKFR